MSIYGGNGDALESIGHAGLKRMIGISELVRSATAPLHATTAALSDQEVLHCMSCLRGLPGPDVPSCAGVLLYADMFDVAIVIAQSRFAEPAQF